MNTNPITASCLSALMLFSLPLHAEITATEISEKETALKNEAINIVKTFGGTLKPKLIQAIETGGLENAIKVCAVEAPAIADRLSKETGWSVKRVSLKARNKNTAIPDDFEQAVLEQFNTQQQNGVLASTIAHSEITDNQYRYMRAQAAEGLCLSCHGSKLSPALKDAIKQHYPNDIAVDYTLGQIRGAFSLSKEL